MVCSTTSIRSSISRFLSSKLESSAFAASKGFCISTYKDIVQYEQATCNRKNDNMQVGWEGLLIDAELSLKEARARVRKITKAIRKVRENIKTGEAFPDYLKNS